MSSRHAVVCVHDPLQRIRLVDDRRERPRCRDFGESVHILHARDRLTGDHAMPAGPPRHRREYQVNKHTENDEQLPPTPPAVPISLPAFRHAPVLAFPPLEIYRVSEPTYSAGAEEHVLDAVMVPIYGPEKTVADLLKFRSRVGLDVAMEALKRYLARSDRNLDRLLYFARICRVTGVLRPYLEALT